MLSPKQVVNRWVDAFNAGDVDALAGLYHEGATNHQVANEPVTGLAAIREMFAAILEWRDPLGLRGCGFFHVVNEKILFQRGYWDKLSFLKQHSISDE